MRRKMIAMQDFLGSCFDASPGINRVSWVRGNLSIQRVPDTEIDANMAHRCARSIQNITGPKRNGKVAACGSAPDDFAATRTKTLAKPFTRRLTAPRALTQGAERLQSP